VIFNLGLLRGKNDGKEAARRPVEEEDERKGECSGQKWYIFYLEPEVRWWRERISPKTWRRKEERRRL
jgi:hypothetical protein